MTPDPQSLDRIVSYHAHVYFDGPEQRLAAASVRDGIAARFRVQLGRWHERPVGPHSRAMCQVAFERSEFPTLVPWLMLNRQGLSVLVHPNTLAPRADHLVHAMWLGEPLDIRGDGLPATITLAEEDPIVPNTGR